MTCSIILFALILLLLRKLRLPYVVRFLLIKIGEDQVEYVRVPFGWPALDALLDVLSHY